MDDASKPDRVIFADGSGHVRIHQYNEAIARWVELGADIDAEAPVAAVTTRV